MTVTEGEGRMAAAQSRMLIAYDGSDPAKRAVAFAASMLPGAHAQVVHVFSSMAGSLALVPPPLLATPPPEPEETSAIERHGQEIADDGEATVPRAITARDVQRELVRQDASLRPELHQLAVRAG